jgi:hypothetical protein
MEHLGYFVEVSDTEVRFQLEKPARSKNGVTV